MHLFMDRHYWKNVRNKKLRELYELVIGLYIHWYILFSMRFKWTSCPIEKRTPPIHPSPVSLSSIVVAGRCLQKGLP